MCAQLRLTSTWASAQSDQSSLSTWGKLRSLSIIGAHREASDQTGWMPRLIWVFAGCKGHFVSFVMRRLIFYFVSRQQYWFLLFRGILFPELPKKVRVFMYPCMCMLVSIYYVILTTVDASHCLYSLLVGPRGDVRVVSLMVNGYADIYKDNRWKHLRTHTISNGRCIITMGLKLYRISVDRTGTIHSGCQTEDYGFQNSEQ